MQHTQRSCCRCVVVLSLSLDGETPDQTPIVVALGSFVAKSLGAKCPGTEIYHLAPRYVKFKVPPGGYGEVLPITKARNHRGGVTPSPPP